MKIKLLAITSLLCGMGLNAQTLFQDNFESYTAGNTQMVTTNLSNAYYGFGDKWITYCESGAVVGDFSIVSDINNKYANVKSGISGTGTSNARVLLSINDLLWANRTTGNDIVEISYSFFTGDVGASASNVQVWVSGADLATVISNTGTSTNYPILGGIHYNPSTKVVSPLMYIVNGNLINNYIINLNTGNPVLAANTWVTVKFSYNKNTGITSYLFPNSTTAVNLQNGINNANFGDVLNVSHYVPASSTVSAKQDYKIDNILVKATNNTNLSVEEQQIATEGSVKVYPNPATNLINVTSTLGVIEHYAIVDLSGKTVKFGEVSNLENLSVNIQDLASGAYIMNIKTNKEIKNIKFVKK